MHLQILVVAVAAMAALGVASAQEESPCESSCGNVTFTFPFGSREGCFHNSDFRVYCNRSSGVPIPIFGGSTGTIVISNMSLDKGELEVMIFVARDCYNSSGSTGSRPASGLRLGNPKGDIRVSTKNTFVAIGCDTNAFFRGTRGKMIDVAGCYSSCRRDSLITNGSCSGIGCCEVAVPQGMIDFAIDLRSYSNHVNMTTDFNPCSYGFFLKNGNFNFSTNYLRDFPNKKMPMLLDWAIGKLTCDQASKNTTSFLCKGNSRCDENYQGPGYRCRCEDGYEGNPYIANNCKNVNECSNGNHDCEHICKDTPGNYTCKCRKG